VLLYLYRWIPLVNTFPTIYICLGFGGKLRALEDLQAIAFSSHPYHPYESITPELSKIPPLFYQFPTTYKSLAERPQQSRSVYPRAQTLPPSVLHIPRLIAPSLHNHWADSHVLNGVRLVSLIAF